MEQLERLGGAHASAPRTIEVSLPVSVAFDLDRFQEVQRSILDRLGCQACCSGWDIRYDIQRRFLVDDKMNIREFG